MTSLNPVDGSRAISSMRAATKPQPKKEAEPRQRAQPRVGVTVVSVSGGEMFSNKFGRLWVGLFNLKPASVCNVARRTAGGSGFSWTAVCRRRTLRRSAALQPGYLAEPHTAGHGVQAGRWRCQGGRALTSGCKAGGRWSEMFCSAIFMENDCCQ